MPTYSYACTSCDNRFDVQQTFTDEPLTQCPECSGRLRKLFGNVGVVFKGSGFYRTDARADRRGRAPARPKSGAAARDGAPASTTGPDGISATKGAASTSSGGSATPSRDSSPSATPTPASARAAAD